MPCPKHRQQELEEKLKGGHIPPGSTLTSASQHTLAARGEEEKPPSIMPHHDDDYCQPRQVKFLEEIDETVEPLFDGVQKVIPADFDSTLAFKADDEKVDMTLLPFSPLEEIAEVLMFGQAKYSRDNWRKGFAHERLMAATMRHLFAYNEGETLDPETGLCHLAHAGCMLLFLMETRHSHPELDYRRVSHETK